MCQNGRKSWNKEKNALGFICKNQVAIFCDLLLDRPFQAKDFDIFGQNAPSTANVKSGIFDTNTLNFCLFQLIGGAAWVSKVLWYL